MYVEASRKWDVLVEGAVDALEARQAFSAVVLTAQMLDPDLLEHALSEPLSDGAYKITPASC